jgi:HAD domain in Swiss Army Knife RNA repair proteins
MNVAFPSEALVTSTKSQPVIFLDIDGVLKRMGKDRERRVDRDLLARFKRLVEKTNARVVLASTWRHDPRGVEDARRLQIPFDDVLPDLRPGSRADEIRLWLATHPETERFAILDDEDDCYGDLPLFQPHARQGITSKLTDALDSYLKGERRRDMRRSRIVQACQAIRFTLFGHKG